MKYAVELTAPNGATHSMARRFNNRDAANRACIAALHGDPFAFWDSERRSAARVRERMRGWSARVVEAE